MKVLHVMPYIPFPFTGARVRDYNIIKSLSDQKIDSELICNYSFDNECNTETCNTTQLEKELNAKIYATKIPADLSVLKKMKVVLFNSMYPPVYRYNTSINKKRIESVLKRNHYDILHTQHIIEAAPTIEVGEKLHFEGCKVITLHNVDHLNFIRQVNHQTNPLRKYVNKRVASGFKEHELNILEKFDHIFVVSGVDKDAYVSYGFPKDRIDVIPNGVDFEFYNMTNDMVKVELNHPNVLFMGSLAYRPNDFGIRSYLEYVHPIVKKQIPNIKFYIIGKNCPNWLKEYSRTDDTVEIIGFVEDVRPYIFNSDVCIAPLTSGSGTRLKILEYMAMGKPVVSTTIGAEGLEVSDKNDILIADEWDVFAHQIITLLNDEKHANRIGINGRKLVEDKYDWKKLVKIQINIYEKLLRRNYGMEVY